MIKKIFKTFALAIIIAGIILLIMGCDYLIFKAGVPYQDPTLELELQYAINTGIGEELIENGGITFGIGLICGIIGLCMNKKKKIETNETEK